MMERSITQEYFRRQTLSLFKRQRSPTSLAPTFTSRFASTVQASTTQPTNVTNEPAYKTFFKQSPSRHPLGPTTDNGEPIWENTINHAVYDLDKIATMEQTHHPIVKMHERVA
ncbi:hypothetical protein PR003_g19631 [Phytophthora rubi]|nr:hypothetical protein PR003_g19631 [Phytophthora rubi]